MSRSTLPGRKAALSKDVLAVLRDVQSALWRMDEGRYGSCVRCHEPIGLERLEILPQTALCLRCLRESTT